MHHIKKKDKWKVLSAENLNKIKRLERLYHQN